MELSLNQATTRPYPLIETAMAASSAGIRHLGLWIEPVQKTGIRQTRKILQDSGLSVSSVCRTGFLADKEGHALTEALDEVKRALELSHEVGAPMLTFIAGGLPPQDRDLARAEARVRGALEQLEPYARDAGVRLALEPLHPLFATSRSVVVTVSQALRLIRDLPAETMGILVDAYATFWDPILTDVLLMCGHRIAGYQVNDFALPLPVPENMNGRLFPGEGEIDLARLTKTVVDSGYTGPVEIEVFNEEIWRLPLETIVQRTVSSFRRSVAAPFSELERLA
jgi:sugar phosphate isomerase/epimerase